MSPLELICERHTDLVLISSGVAAPVEISRIFLEGEEGNIKADTPLGEVTARHMILGEKRVLYTKFPGDSREQEATTTPPTSATREIMVQKSENVAYLLKVTSRPGTKK